MPLTGTGYVGFWLKTDDAGGTVRIAIDDPVASRIDGDRTRRDCSTSSPITSGTSTNGTLQDAINGIALGNAGSDGDIDATSGSVTIDSIWFTGTGNAQIYLDNVMHNPNRPDHARLHPRRLRRRRARERTAD